MDRQLLFTISHDPRRFKEGIASETFDYLIPLENDLSAYGLSSSFYVEGIEYLKDGHEYDYIIIDTNTGISDLNVALFQQSDSICMLLQQDGLSIEKMNHLLKSINMHDDERYLLILNRYDENKQDEHTSLSDPSLPIASYIHDHDLTTQTDIFNSEALSKLCWSFL